MSEQTFIGKGKRTESGRIRVNINLTEAAKFATSHKGIDYLNCMCVELKTPDQYGNTHTVYSFPKEAEAVIEDQEVSEAAPAEKTKRRKK